MATPQLLDEIAQGHGKALSQIARLFPSARRGRPMTFSAVLRWVLDGVPGPSGERIRLDAARVSGRWLSSQAAVSRFVAAQTPSLDADPPTTPRAPAARRRASERAAAELEARGI